MNEAKSISLPSSSPHPSIIERLFKLIQLNCFSVSEEKKNQRSDVGGEKKSHRCRATFLRSKKKNVNLHRARITKSIKVSQISAPPKP